MNQNQNEIHYQHTVGLKFQPRDVPALLQLASRDHTHDPEEVSVFQKAANCAASGEQLVVQVMHRNELEQVFALFSNYGIVPVLEPLRVQAPATNLSKRFRVKP